MAGIGRYLMVMEFVLLGMLVFIGGLTVEHIKGMDCFCFAFAEVTFLFVRLDLGLSIISIWTNIE
jgi:hypothetical protein